MKKNVYLLIMFILGIHIIQARPVTPITAKNIALIFYQQHSTIPPQTLTLAYTETSPTTGEALYYVFNVNANDGFVIVTADDAAHPIIGYSTERKFVVPEGNTNFSFWMNHRKKEIMGIKAASGTFKVLDEISREWSGDFSSSNNNLRQANNSLNSVTTTSVAPLLKSDWSQSPYYNADCPGASGNAGTSSSACVTGCVATTMAQIMRYWSYPAHGTGSSSYNAGSTYGTLSANYGTTTYNWAGMPLNDNNITSTASTYSAVALLMSQCGISVEMNYSPSGSGAYVLQVDNPGGACAQNSYTVYFGYNPSTIKGYQLTNSQTGDSITGGVSAWLNLIKNDLNIGRPVQYAGQDKTQGGHTWVCDGYDATNKIHMEWGWAGQDDGYFTVENLSTGSGSSAFNPIESQEILVGIVPPAGVDVGISAINSPSGVLCASTFTPYVTIQNFGVNTVTVATINYGVTGETAKTYTWTGSLTTGQTATVSLPAYTTTVSGNNTFTCATTVPNHTVDANSANDETTVIFVNGATGAALPLAENFEGSTSLPGGWSVSNTPSGNPAWGVVSTTSYSTGTNCVTIDNFDGNTVGTASACIGETAWFYTGSYNLSSTASYSLTFDVAYALLSGYSDSLAVYASVNCGSTWAKVYQKGGSVLSTTTTTNQNTAWVPTTAVSNWRTEGINISSYAGKPSVMFGFKNVSGYGENIFIDNINIKNVGNTTGISNVNSLDGINLYPNPAHNNIFINTTEKSTSISVTDVIGQTVIADQRVNSSEQVQSIDISNLAEGVYLVKVLSSDNQVKVIRFIKN